jgi:hypothetical protein
MNTNSTEIPEMLTTATQSAHNGLLSFETLLRTLSDADLHLANTEGGGRLHRLSRIFSFAVSSGLPTLSVYATSRSYVYFERNWDMMPSAHPHTRLRKRLSG